MSVAKKSVLLNILLCLATAIVSAAIGAYLGLQSARTADPLVGGAMILMSALLGGTLGLVLGGIMAWKLPAYGVRLGSAVLGVPAAVLLVLAARGMWHMDQQTRDPDEAYRGLPVFTATLVRDPGFDPVLAPRVTIDARERRWSVALPDGRSCTGRLRAEVQERVAQFIPGGPLDPVCRAAPPAGDMVRLEWRVEGGGAAAVRIDEACHQAHPELRQFAAMLSRAPSLADSAPSCD